jgi:2-polyprenyl-6-methoxyphenol hydroxylase-like FAD-dependent oxidoreductase
LNKADMAWLLVRIEKDVLISWSSLQLVGADGARNAQRRCLGRIAGTGAVTTAVVVSKAEDGRRPASPRRLAETIPPATPGRPSPMPAIPPAAGRVDRLWYGLCVIDGMLRLR